MVIKLARVKTYEEIVKNIEDYIFIDVRSPGEYEYDTIPTAINIPLLDNDERAEVGTLYKQKSPFEAKSLSMTFVGNKLNDIFLKVTDISISNKGKTIVAFCARGGMRSNSFASLFASIGINIIKLDGGYKSYREFVRKNLENELNKVDLTVIYGKTGVGKTILLNQIKNKGYGMIDLEGCANHRGSLLGSVGKEKQFTQKKFESLILNELIRNNYNHYFVEGESKRIGRVIMPEYLFDKIESSEKLYIDADIDLRIEVIYNDYINNLFKHEQVMEAFEKMSSYTSKNKLNMFKNLLETKQYKQLIKELMEQYYDINYNSENRTDIKSFYNDGDFDKLAENIINYKFKSKESAE